MAIGKVYYSKNYKLQKLVVLKRKKNETVGLALPILNEEKTIRKTLSVIRRFQTLIDQVIIIDSGSTDKSVKICKKMGFKVVTDLTASRQLQLKLQRGKGWNMWASLYYLKTDIIVWVDTDIKNFSPRFFLGQIGPLLENPKLQFIKGFYKRPKGDARVTEIMVRPFTNIFFPSIANVVQPLSGEYGGRRIFLAQAEFFSGYSVEIALLIQAYHKLSSNERAQVHLGNRVHPLQDVPSLGRMSASILRTMLWYAKKYSGMRIRRVLSPRLRQFLMSGNSIETLEYSVADTKLPPMNTVSAYVKRKE